MSNNNMDEVAREIARPKARFDDFEKKTGPLWTWWARRLVRDVPPWLDVDDVRQELLIEAWRSAGRWQEKKGSRPGVWVVQAALQAGRKAVMRARGVNRHIWRFNEPGRHDVGVDEIELSVDADQENALLEEALVREVVEEHGPLAGLIVQAIAACDGDLNEAATMIYDDADARLLFRLGNEESAVRVVKTTVEQIATARRRDGDVGRSDSGYPQGRQEAHVCSSGEAWCEGFGCEGDLEGPRDDVCGPSGE